MISYLIRMEVYLDGQVRWHLESHHRFNKPLDQTHGVAFHNSRENNGTLLWFLELPLNGCNDDNIILLVQSWTFPLLYTNHDLNQTGWEWCPACKSATFCSACGIFFRYRLLRTAISRHSSPQHLSSWSHLHVFRLSETASNWRWADHP